MARYYIQVGIHATNIDEYLLYTKCHINLWVKMVNKTKQNKTNKQKTTKTENYTILRVQLAGAVGQSVCR